MADQHLVRGQLRLVPIIWFLIKVGILLFCFIWLRGTLPRIRYDQLMRFGWKVLIPVSLVWILVIATIRVWRTHGGSPGVYIVAGLLLVTLLALLFMADTAMQRRQEAAAKVTAADEAGGGHRAGPGGRLGRLPGPAPGPAALPRNRGNRVHRARHIRVR